MELVTSYEDGWYTLTSPMFPGVCVVEKYGDNLKSSFLKAVALWVEGEYDIEIGKARKFR